MQLKTPLNITAALAAASATLLTGQAQASDSLVDGWQVNTAFLAYAETDRVKAGEAIVQGRKDFGDDEYLNLNLVFDTLTGASPTGAVPQNTAQTFSRPSGQGSYTIAAGETPLDNTFHDTRVQLDSSWEQPLSKDWKGSVGGHFSKEYDYLSLGVNAGVSRDLNNKNTTLSFGTSFSFDTINPEGGIPIALAPVPTRTGGGGEDDDDEGEWEDEHDQSRGGNSDTKTTSELLFGVTQVLSKNWLTQLNYSYAKVDGYMTDPFKMLSVVDTGGIDKGHLYESRPDSRTKQSLFWQNKVAFANTYLDVSYRYYWDDWGLKSDTIDTRWRLPLGGEWFVEPHVRYYQQGAADFYTPFLNQGAALPQFASADYRIGEMDAYTIGAKVGTKLSGDREASVRLEFYQQSPKNPGVEIPGVLKNLDVFADVKAVMLQVNYSF